ncbi:hypothetical protein, partial [Vibrio parahaemolyticus]
LYDFHELTNKPNAALRGECRLNQLSADHFHHQNSPHTKNATRHESLFNALLGAGAQLKVTY